MQFTKDVMQIKAEVKLHLINMYLQSCSSLYQIAFMEWRSLCSPSNTQDQRDEILELRKAMLAKQRIASKKRFKEYMEKSEHFKLQREVPIDLFKMQNYIKIQKTKSDENWLINDFGQIGWPDFILKYENEMNKIH